MLFHFLLGGKNVTNHMKMLSSDFFNLYRSLPKIYCLSIGVFPVNERSMGLVRRCSQNFYIFWTSIENTQARTGTQCNLILDCRFLFKIDYNFNIGYFLCYHILVAGTLHSKFLAITLTFSFEHQRFSAAVRSSVFCTK